MTSPSFVRRIRANAAHLTTTVHAVKDREYRSLDPEWHNFLQAIHTGLEHPEAFAETAALWAALIGFVESRGYFGTWQTITGKVAEVVPALPADLACRVANEAGFFLDKVNEYTRSLEMHTAALTLAESVGDGLERALAILGKGNLQASLRNYDEAETEILEALKILDELDVARLHYSSALDLLGLIAAHRGDYDRAQRLLKQAAQGFLEAGHHRKAAGSWQKLAWAQNNTGNFRAAIETSERALGLLKPGIDHVARTNLLTLLGTAFFNLDETERAKEAFLAVDQQYLETHGLLEPLMWTTNNLGNVALKESDWEAARDYLSYSIRLARILGNGMSLGNSLGDLATVLLNLGEREAARSALDEAIEALAGYPENAWARKRLAAILAQRRDAFG